MQRTRCESAWPNAAHGLSLISAILLTACGNEGELLDPEISTRSVREFSASTFTAATATRDTIVLVFRDSTHFLSIDTDLQQGRSQPSVDGVVTQVASSGSRTVVRTRGERVYFSDHGGPWVEWRTPITDSVDVGSDYVSAWFYEDLEYADGSFWMATEKGHVLESDGDEWTVAHIVDSGMWSRVVWDVALWEGRGIAVTSSAISERVGEAWRDTLYRDDSNAPEIDCFISLAGINSSAAVIAGGAQYAGCVFLKETGAATWRRVTPTGLGSGVTRAAKDSLGRVAFWNSFGDIVLLEGSAVRYMRSSSHRYLRTVQPLDDGRILFVHMDDDGRITVSLLDEP